MNFVFVSITFLYILFHSHFHTLHKFGYSLQTSDLDCDFRSSWVEENLRDLQMFPLACTESAQVDSLSPSQIVTCWRKPLNSPRDELCSAINRGLILSTKGGNKEDFPLYHKTVTEENYMKVKKSFQVNPLIFYKIVRGSANTG